ncbi:putative phage abortive infection protein [Methylotenera sp.]|uniref:putative phage abortive infection protein n=1 Tax=Methylotenera sp. TaxID=2051956 RepID=UPI002EDB4610
MKIINFFQKIANGYSGLIALVLLVIALWAMTGWILYPYEQRGTIGDMFGSINALFSGLAFAVLIYTIHLQRKELELQREELASTRNEIKEQKEYLAAQNDVLRTQNFENTFFQLLNLMQETRNSFVFRRVPSKKGVEAFEHAYANLKSKYLRAINDEVALGKTKEEVVNILSTQFFIEYQSDFGHYFRTLYNIVKLVNISNVANKRFYTNLIRAQLSNQEVFILFYDCLSSFGKHKFKPLLEEYSLLKIIRPDMLIDRYHYSMYDSKAFE